MEERVLLTAQSNFLVLIVSSVIIRFFGLTLLMPQRLGLLSYLFPQVKTRALDSYFHATNKGLQVSMGVNPLFMQNLMLVESLLHSALEADQDKEYSSEHFAWEKHVFLAQLLWEKRLMKNIWEFPRGLLSINLLNPHCCTYVIFAWGRNHTEVKTSSCSNRWGKVCFGGSLV